MTSFKKVRNKVKELAQRSEDEHSIVKHGNNYRVLGRYDVMPTVNNTWLVLDDYRSDELEFNAVKNAISYCMAVNAGNRELAKDLHSLDNKYYQKQFDVQNKIHLLSNNTMDPEVRAIMVVKLDEDVKLSKYLKTELQKRLNRAKYIKVKGSHYEFTGLGASCD